MLKIGEFHLKAQISVFLLRMESSHNTRVHSLVVNISWIWAAFAALGEQALSLPALLHFFFFFFFGPYPGPSRHLCLGQHVINPMILQSTEMVVLNGSHACSKCSLLISP